MKNLFYIIFMFIVFLSIGIFVYQLSFNTTKYTLNISKANSMTELNITNNLTLNNQSIITPGFEPYFSCQLETAVPANITIINTTGFKVYKVGSINDYVIQEGADGSITYSIGNKTMQSNQSIIPEATVASQNYNKNNVSNINNEAFDSVVLYHQTQINENYTVTKITSNITANSNSEGVNLNNTLTSNISENKVIKYKVCYSAQGTGTVCSYTTTPPINNNETKKVNEISMSHNGVNLNINSKSNLNSAKINFVISSSAQKGTYWMSIAGGPCNGAALSMLTIGTSPYNTNIDNKSGIYS